MFTTEEKYQFLIDILDSVPSDSVKAFLMDNIFELTTVQESILAQLLKGYWETGRPELPSKYRAKILHAFRLGKTLLEVMRNMVAMRTDWCRDLMYGKEILLIYVPNEKYFSVAEPVYTGVRAKLGLRSILIYESSRNLHCFSKYDHLNLSKFPVAWAEFGDSCGKIIKLRNEVRKNPDYRDFLSSVFSATWFHEFRILLRQVRLKHLFKNCDGNIIGVFNCMPTSGFGNDLNIVASRFGKPTFSFRKDTTYHDVENFFIHTDFLFAKGKYELDIYKRAGLEKKSRIYIVGSPQGMNSRPFPRRGDGNKIRIMFVDQHIGELFPQESKGRFSAVLGNVLRLFPRFELAIKLHPSTTDCTVYAAAFSKAGFTNYVVYPICTDIYTAISESDYVLMFSSTVGFDAILMRKPLLVLSDAFLGIEFKNFFFDERVAHTIKDERELYQLIKNIEEGSFNRKDERDIAGFLEEHMTYTGAESLTKIVDLLEEKISAKQKGRDAKIRDLIATR